MSTAIVTSTSSTSSTTTPEMITVSETSTLSACSYFIDREQCLTPSSFDLNTRLSVRAPRRDVDLGATGFSHRRSADAKTLVVGAPGLYDNTDREGYVKVYRMTDDGGSSTQLGQTIYGNATGDRLGYSVDVTAQGNVIVLSSPGWSGYNDRPGYVQVFSRHVRIYRLSDDGARWEQIGEDIYGDAAGDWSGISVSLSANGSIVAIGAPYAGIDGVLQAGQVKVYRIDSGGSKWEQLGQSIYGDNENDAFGYSVDITPDGNSLAVGTFVTNGGPGYVKVFSLENGGGDDDDDLGASSWKQIGLTITGEANGDRFGSSVSLSEDAKTLAVGAPYANDFDSGHVRVYRRDDSESGWTQIGEDIDGEATYDYSGYSVSLSGDGKTVAIGAIGSLGNVRVFVAE